MDTKENVCSSLPHFLKSLFWDCDFSTLSLENNRAFIVRRVLSSGGLEHLRWLRSQVGDEAIYVYLRHTHGRAISRARIRFFEAIFNLPAKEVFEWLSMPERQIWDRRAL